MSAASLPRPGGREIAFALCASLVSAAAAASLGLVLDDATVVRAVATGLGLVCLLRALAQGGVRNGTLAAVVLFGSGAAVAWLLAPPTAVFVVALISMLWLARALVLAATVRAAAVDFAIVATGVVFAGWAAARTGSVGLTVWCVLLALAFTTRPAPPGRERRLGTESRFATALRAGEDALSRLAAENLHDPETSAARRRGVHR